MLESSPTELTPETTATFLTAPRRSKAERRKAGKALRADVPRASHAELPARADRPDPVALLRSQEDDREPGLVPLRYERMAQDPFAFLRGAALVMANDLSSLPRTALIAQLCGDAHLSNVGMFAAPDRRLVLDVNDFDETLSGPFDWDVKRLAASMAVAGLVNGIKGAKVHRAAVATVQTYRETVKRIAQMSTLDAWFARIDVDPLLDRLRGTDLQARPAGPAPRPGATPETSRSRS